MRFFSRKPSIPSELIPVEDTIKLAMKPWKGFVNECGSMGMISTTQVPNIISKTFIPDLASAIRVANIILHTAQKELDPDYTTLCLSKRCVRTDNGQFFYRSAVNFLASVLYYFVHKFPIDRYGDEEYVDLPHVLAFLQLDTMTMLEVLHTCEEVRFAILPFNVCIRDKSFDQFDAMLTTALVDLAPLATQENFWMLSRKNTGDEDKEIIHTVPDPHGVLRSHYLAVQQEVRDYKDYLLGIREKPVTESSVDEQPLYVDIPEGITVLDEPTDGIEEQESISQEKYAYDEDSYERLLKKRCTYMID